jgi:hypothetical protein
LPVHVASISSIPEEISVPIYRIEALEKFVVRTIYEVEATCPEEAERLCKAGEIAYGDQTIEEGNEEWLETVSIETCE